MSKALGPILISESERLSAEVTEVSEDGIDLRSPGDLSYYHYGCDGFDDRGWGCGYRTLQTLCSWIKERKGGREVPSLPEVQEILAKLEDKPRSFVGSRGWIGSFEVFLVLDHRYDVSSKIIHVRRGGRLNQHWERLAAHFEAGKCPVMMGGDLDASSKCVLGVRRLRGERQFLVADPHLWRSHQTASDLYDQGWISWMSVDRDFADGSFYNLCLPQC